MRKLLTILALSACAQTPLLAAPVAVEECCDEAELRVVGDCNYDSRVILGHSGEISSRLYQQGVTMKDGSWRTWSDPDRGLILGYIAASPCGSYPPNNAVIKAFAAEIGVTVKSVTLTPAPIIVPPAPPPVVVPPAPATSVVIPMPTAPPGCPLPAGRTVLTAKLATCLAYESARVTALLTYLTGPTTAVSQVVRGDLQVDRLCVGGPCLNTADATIQLRNRGSAEILLSSNEGGLSPQWGVRPGFSVISGGGDLGLRLIHNSYWGPGGMVWPDTLRMQTILAFDSQGTLSLSQDRWGYPRDRSQALVLRQDYNNRIMAFTGMRAGWRMCLGWSTVINDFVNLYCPPGGNSSRPRGAGAPSAWTPPAPYNGPLVPTTPNLR